MLDLVSPSQAQLEQAAQAIGAARATANGPVLVCCALGFSRSALAVAAGLLYALAFPPYNLVPLIFVFALPPLA